MIISKKPRERFQAETTHIPKEYSAHYKYLLNIKEHFSRFMWSFPLKTLTSLEVYGNLKWFFDLGNVPKIFQTDNGTEFRGEITKLLNTYDIKHIRSKPNSPKTQGIVQNSISIWKYSSILKVNFLLILFT